MKLGDFELDMIYTGDARELAQGLPDKSVDLIFTDPPWDDASMPLYEWLADISARILKPGGFVLAYTGNDWLPEIMGYFQSAGLSWFRMLSGVQLESNDRYFKKKLFVKWRPIVVYTQGQGIPFRWLPDAHHTNRDKRWHKWGQGEQPIRKWLDALCPPTGIVFEPFTGGATTIAVCKQFRRHYLAFEIDPTTADKARQRIHNTQPPLFVTQSIQAELFP